MATEERAYTNVHTTRCTSGRTATQFYSGTRDVIFGRQAIVQTGRARYGRYKTPPVIKPYYLNDYSALDFVPHHEYFSQQGSLYYHVEGQMVSKAWSVNDYGSIDPYDLVWQEAYAVDKVYEKASKADFPTLVNLGELRETIESIRHPLSALANLRKHVVKEARTGWTAYRKYKKRLKIWQAGWRHSKTIRNRTVRLRIQAKLRSKRPKLPRGTSQAMTASKVSDAIAGTWMEYRYAWTPVVLQLDQGAKYLANTILRKCRYERITGFQETKDGWVDLPASVASLPYARWQIQKRRLLNYHTAVGLYIGYNELSGSAALRAQLGLTLMDVPQALWEWTRLSWMFDWFLDVTRFLRIMFPAKSYYVQAGWVSVVQRFRCEYRVSNVLLNYKPAILKLGSEIDPWITEKTIMTREVRIPDALGFPLWNYGIKNLIRSADFLSVVLAVLKRDRSIDLTKLNT